MYAGVADLADAGAARFVALFAIAHNAMFGGTDPRLRSKASRLALFALARRLERQAPHAKVRRSVRTATGRLAHHLSENRAGSPR